MTLDRIIEEIDNAKTIAILTHENPDGDAIGSSLALYLALKKYGKNSDVIIPEYPETYDFLPGAKSIIKESEVKKYDLAIALDCSDSNRLNGFVNYFDDAKVRISIDHHSSNKMFADYNFVNPESPATAQILIIVLEAMGVFIDKEIGTCLLTGIITDTGGFKYQNVNAVTFEFVAELLSVGVNVSKTYKRVLETKTKAQFQLTKIVTNRMEFLENDKVTFTYITKEDQEEVNAKVGDHDGLVEIGKSLEGVEVSVFLRETDHNTYKVSLRSNEYINVSDVALMFGGGGHIRAAGCSIQGSLDQVKNKVITEIRNVLK